jgi:hypothetical protein
MTHTPDPATDTGAVSILDLPHAPDVFADRLHGAFLCNGNIHMTLVSRRCDYAAQPSAFTDTVIGRLVMPFDAAERAAKFLLEFVERMKKVHSAASPEMPKTLQ